MTTAETGDVPKTGDVTETVNQQPLGPKPPVRRRYCTRCCCAAVSALIVLLVVIVVLVLALTVFKSKDPTTTITSVRVSGVSPRVSFPALNIKLNVSINLGILVQNPNRASFKHGPGESVILYRQTRVGEADMPAGRIPPRGSESIQLGVTIEADRFGSDLGSFLSDVISGEVGFDTAMRIPGKVTALRIFKKHAVSVIQCHLDVGFPNLTIQHQACQNQFRA